MLHSDCFVTNDLRIVKSRGHFFIFIFFDLSAKVDYFLCFETFSSLVSVIAHCLLFVLFPSLTSSPLLDPYRLEGTKDMS